MTDIGVFIADDHPIVRKGIREILDSAIGIKVLGEAESGGQCLEMVREMKPDVLILDMELPDINGVEVLLQLAEGKATVHTLALSSYDDREYISQMLLNGASGYLIKDEVPEMIVEAVRGVARGETGWVSRKVATRLSQILKEDKADKGNLTSRELDVLRLLVEAQTNAEIAFNLGISEKTVEKHLESIFKKLGVASRVEAAVLAVRENYF
jgi:DNA-binding NarL/FixJ family response regulator